MSVDASVASGFSTISTLIQLLDFFGCVTFAAAGAFKAIEHRFDIVGVIILSSITGVGGAMIRDMVLGISPPFVLLNPLYLGLTVSAGITVSLLYGRLVKYRNLFIKLDSVGSGAFTAGGAIVALNVVGPNLLVMGFAGVLTAIAGGILRDVLAREIPAVFVKELYASASIAGVLVIYVLDVIGADLSLAIIIGIAAVISIRLMATRYGWNLPKARV